VKIACRPGISSFPFLLHFGRAFLGNPSVFIFPGKMIIKSSFSVLKPHDLPRSPLFLTRQIAPNTLWLTASIDHGDSSLLIFGKTRRTCKIHKWHLNVYRSEEAKVKITGECMEVHTKKRTGSLTETTMLNLCHYSSDILLLAGIFPEQERGERNPDLLGYVNFKASKNYSSN